MRLDSKLLSLPASILLLIASHLGTSYADNEKAAARWSFSLLSKLQWPSESTNRDTEAANGGEKKPTGVLKMSDDEGEKFYMEYWQFGGNTPQAQTPMLSLGPTLRGRDEEEALLLANSSIPISYRAAFALHTDEFYNPDLKARGEKAAGALALLQNRQFSCPTGTARCSAIGYPNSCCATDETCFQITDTGLGSVGCCPNGSTCGGSVTTCNAPNTACPDDNGGGYTGGGCCIPDFVCAGVGCVLNATSVSTSLSTSTSIGSTSTSFTVITVVTPVTATTVVTISPTDSTSSSSSTPISSQSTPSTSITDTTTTSTATGVVPVRPTGSTTTSTSSSDAATTCPVGFYACEAYYAGGCCRTGRNCDTTSCPATSSTTIISSGVTIVVPVGAAATTANPTGNCASGWSTCSASLGGDCCPSGYACGTASCSLVEATGTAVSPKEAAGGGRRLEVRKAVVVLGAIVGILVLI